MRVEVYKLSFADRCIAFSMLLSRLQQVPEIAAFLGECYLMACVYHVLLTRSPLHGHLGGCHFLGIKRNAVLCLQRGMAIFQYCTVNRGRN